MPAQEQPLLRPRNGDVEEAFFFFYTAFFHGPVGGERAVFQAGQEDVVEFQTFGLVDGDDRDFRVLFQDAVQFTVGQGGKLEEFRQGIARILFRIVAFLSDTVEFADIFHPVDVLARAVCIRVAFIPGLDAAIVHYGGDKVHGPCRKRAAAKGCHFPAEGGEEGQVHGHGGAPGSSGGLDVFFNGIDEETGCGQDVVEGVVRRLVRDGEGLAQCFQLVVDELGIEAAVDVERVVIGKIGVSLKAQALQLAVQDGQVIGNIVTDDDRILGKE